MATPGRVAIKTQKQVQEIMEAVNKMTVEIAELKPVELTAEFKDSSVLTDIVNDVAELKRVQSEIYDIVIGIKASIEDPKPKRRGRKPKSMEVSEE
jgi:hypothetical protein